jgi:ketosteroid isomerase-like protein|tara:strand:+ start:442 stop:831 length:390 start_codon:yes stop_codon:yes gene_type:complete
MILEEEAKAANERFYKAFNSQNLLGMQGVWSTLGPVSCIHPGWPPLNGYESIIKSWKDIFSNTDNMEIKLSEVEALVSDDLAWIRCQENLFSISMTGVQASKVISTNLFQMFENEWKMVLHHASHLPHD